MAAVEPSAITPGPDPAVEGEDRILTVPNIITLVRLGLLPVFVYLLFGPDEPAAAAALLAGLGATDWVDGYIARHYHQVSTLGKVLDPVADRLLFFVGITAILVYGAIPLWVALMILVRELVVAITTVVIAVLGAKRIDVTWFGKAGTFCLMFAVPLFLASSSDLAQADAFGFLAWVFVIPGLVFSYVSWAMYVPLALRALREGRAARQLSPAS